MKLKLFGILVIFVLLASSITVGNKNAVKTLERNNGDKKDYINIKMENISFTRFKGEPILPVQSVTLSFPLGTIIKNVECTPWNCQRKSCLPPELIPVNGGVYSILKEGKTYESNEPYPSNWYAYRTAGGLENGIHVTFLNIDIYPMRYIPEENMAMYVSNATITISYEEKNLLSVPDEYDLLIISPLTYKVPLMELVKHKESYGIKTKWVSLSQIYDGNYFPSEGRDSGEKIKYFIKNAIEQWGIEYVLLVGGTGRIPARKVYTYEGSENYFLSDLYYADIYDSNGHFSSWDSNENGYYGEYNHSGNMDVMDLYPDVYVGRLPCRSVFEAYIVVNKIITYEKMEKGSWFNKMIVVGGDSFNDSQWGTDYYEGEITVEKSLEYMEDFVPIKILGSKGNLSTDNIIKEFSNGAGFINFEGHGNYLSWATHPPHEYGTWIGISAQDIPKLKNGKKLPVVVVGGCHTSELKKFYECFGWRLVRAIGGGGIASTGFTSLSWGADDDVNGNGKPDIIEYASGYIDTLFFKKYGEEGINVLGRAFGDSITEYLNTSPVEWNNAFLDIWDCKTVSSWILFGDPSLKIGGYGGYGT
ncbi:MAG: C25 family cysteine peptidase [Candidatus Thermoplasmatota archaeon]|nr:C25 family cysteine peptidase [Candidatus Thermoplasmatota archaeon]